MTYPAITGAAALTNLGNSWTETWDGLVAGERGFISTSNLHGLESAGSSVAAMDWLERATTPRGEGPASRLLDAVLKQLGPMGNARLYAGSNHGEAELIRDLLSGATPDQARVLLDEPLRACGAFATSWTYGACASGLHALIAAALDYRDGFDGEAVVAAADALSLIEVLGFARSGALSLKGARPFAVDRDGLTIGEGAAAVRLRARTRTDEVGILGVGMSCDGYHPTDPDPGGEHLERAVWMACSDASMEPEAIGAVMAHGTGTPKGDEVETDVLRRVWTEKVPEIISIKGQVGHLMGVAGLLNVLVAIEACRTGLLPRGSRFPPGSGVSSMARGRPILCLASGFGGNNAAVVIGQGDSS